MSSHHVVVQITCPCPLTGTQTPSLVGTLRDIQKKAAKETTRGGAMK